MMMMRKALVVVRDDDEADGVGGPAWRRSWLPTFTSAVGDEEDRRQRTGHVGSSASMAFARTVPLLPALSG